MIAVTTFDSEPVPLVLLSHVQNDPIMEPIVAVAGTPIIVSSAHPSHLQEIITEEAAVTAELYGNHVVRVYDVGVAGIHRLLHRLPDFEDANAVVAVAGMEGALVSVIGGLVSCPVVGVPTSVGYGANFGGLAALLSMLNSCASGVSVVNIDNGFGAGVLASKMNHQACRK